MNIPSITALATRPISAESTITRLTDTDPATRTLGSSRLISIDTATRTITRAVLTTTHSRATKTYRSVLTRLTTVDGVERPAHPVSDTVVVEVTATTRYNAKTMARRHDQLTSEFLTTEQVRLWAKSRTTRRPRL